MIDRNSDMTMPELVGSMAEATIVQPPLDSTGQFQRKFGFAKERYWLRPSGIAPRLESSVTLGRSMTYPAVRAEPRRVVFIDRSFFRTNSIRQRGSLQQGARLKIDAPFGLFGTQACVAGLGAEALIAPWEI